VDANGGHFHGLDSVWTPGLHTPNLGPWRAFTRGCRPMWLLSAGADNILFPYKGDAQQRLHKLRHLMNARATRHEKPQMENVNIGASGCRRFVRFMESQSECFSTTMRRRIFTPAMANLRLQSTRLVDRDRGRATAPRFGAGRRLGCIASGRIVGKLAALPREGSTGED
jgi:hypothetical protein